MLVLRLAGMGRHRIGAPVAGNRVGSDAKRPWRMVERDDPRRYQTLAADRRYAQQLH